MNIKIEPTDKVLSSNGGLYLFKKLADKVELSSLVAPCLPTQKRSGLSNSLRKFEDLILGFQAGADCLDDMARLEVDAGFGQICGGRLYSPKAYGDFLRSFSEYECKQLNLKLIDLSYKLRPAVAEGKTSITFDFDSTSNQQYGKKMEGVAMNYQNIECLDTIQAFDELGLHYWQDVRPGNTYSSEGIAEIVHYVFSRMPTSNAYAAIRRYVRADSAFFRSDFFNACQAKNAGFVVCMRMLPDIYEPLVANVSQWRSCVSQDAKRLMFYDGRECEVGETIYFPDGVERPLRAVFIRAVKKGREHLLFKAEGDYDYQGWVTSIGSAQMSAEQVVKFYRGRGQAENYIKELKYGLDLHHYPCLKLVANKAYALIGAFAYTLMRFISLKSFSKPAYAKAIRFRFVHLPVQLVRHGGQMIFKFMDHHYKEMQKALSMIKTLQLGKT